MGARMRIAPPEARLVMGVMGTVGASVDIRETEMRYVTRPKCEYSTPAIS
jgi:hypothetical protein